MRVVFLLVLVGLALGGAWAMEASMYSEFDEIVPEKATAHFSWGKPLKGGGISVLFIAPRFTLHDVAELGSRLEITYDTLPLWDAHCVGKDERTIPGSSSEKTLAALEQLLSRKHDVIVLGNFELGILPDTFWSALSEKVSAGAGLVVANGRGKMPKALEAVLANLEREESSVEITRGIGAALTPEWPSELGFVTAGKHGAGRVVHLDYVTEPAYSHFLIPALSDPLRARTDFLDTYFSLVAKAVRWASDRNTGLWVAGIADTGTTGPAEDEIPPGLPEDYIQEVKAGAIKPLYRSYTLKLNKAADKDYAVRAQVREPNRGLRLEYSKLRPLGKGQEAYLLELPLGPGRYFLDMWLMDKKAVAEWHTEIITVKDWPEVSDLAYSKGYLLPNDSLIISMTVRAQYQRPRPALVYARAFDSMGRLVSEGRSMAPADGGSVQVTLNFADLLANLVKVEVFVADTQNARPARWELEHATYMNRYFAVRAPRGLEAPFFAAEAPAVSEYNVREYLEGLRKLSVDTLFLPGSEDGKPPTEDARFYAAFDNFRAAPELTRFRSISEEGNVRKPCLSDGAWRKSEADKIAEAAKAFWTIGTNFYSMGRDNCLGQNSEDLCRCAECMAGFRNALQKQYGAIGTLDEAWGASYTAWESVAPATREEAAASGHWASWLDFRLYMDTVFADAHAFLRDTVRGIDVDGRVGFRAAPGSSARLGYDWWLLGSQLDAVVVEPDPVTVEMLRSYRPAKAASALVYGGDPQTFDTAHARWFPWYGLLHGMQGLWFTHAFGGTEVETAAVGIEPDGTISPVLMEAARTMGELECGVGSLLLNARRQKPSIAVYGSQASYYINQADLRFRNDSRGAETSFIKLLEHLGYTFDFVSPAQARQGKLKAYALLILPMVRAMDDDEAARIRKFVEEGGSLLADVAPGEFDGHGAPRATAPFDDLLGVVHRAKPSPGKVVDGQISSSDALRVSGTLSGITADTSVAVGSGIVAGLADGTPIWIVSGRKGSAFTALLNHSIPLYPSGNEQDGVLAGLMQALLKRAGIAKAAPVEMEEDAWPGACCTLSYGKAEIYAFLPDPGIENKRSTLRLKAGNGLNLYDLLSGKRIKNGKAKVTAGGGPAVFAGLPYEVKKVDLAVPEKVRQGKRLPVSIGIGAGNDLPGDHLVHFTLTRVTKRNLAPALAHYSRDVVCKNGEGSLFIPLALNEIEGAYVVTVRDILTGCEQRRRIEVVP